MPAARANFSSSDVRTTIGSFVEAKAGYAGHMLPDPEWVAWLLLDPVRSPAYDPARCDCFGACSTLVHWGTMHGASSRGRFASLHVHQVSQQTPSVHQEFKNHGVMKRVWRTCGDLWKPQLMEDTV